MGLSIEVVMNWNRCYTLTVPTICVNDVQEIVDRYNDLWDKHKGSWLKRLFGHDELFQSIETAFLDAIDALSLNNTKPIEPPGPPDPMAVVVRQLNEYLGLPVWQSVEPLYFEGQGLSGWRIIERNDHGETIPVGDTFYSTIKGLVEHVKAAEQASK